MRGGETSHRVFWRSLQPPGMEVCAASEDGAGWRLHGSVVRRAKEGPATLSYTIWVDHLWRTKQVAVEEVFRSAALRVELAARDGRWFVDAKETPELDGCVDVDLEASPVTNTLPIKRTGLKVGETTEVKVAWVRFPTLKVVPLKQSYERVGASEYVYRSLSGFKAGLELDSFGLVKRYGEYWVAE